MWMAWGPELTFFYNDAYRPMTLGAKHPWALGPAGARGVGGDLAGHRPAHRRPCSQTGGATWDEALLLFLERSGYPRGDLPHLLLQPAARRRRPASRGMLCVVTEETERVIGERRLAHAARARPPSSPAPTPEPRCSRRAGAPRSAPTERPAVRADLSVRGRRRAPRLACATGIDARPPGGARADRAHGCRRLAGAPSCSRTGAAAVDDLDAPLRSAADRAPGTGRRAGGRRADRPARARTRPAGFLVAGAQSRTGRSTTATRLPRAARRPDRGRPRQRRAPTRRSGGAPRRWPSSTAPRPRSSPTSATSSARR